MTKSRSNVDVVQRPEQQSPKLKTEVRVLSSAPNLSKENFEWLLKNGMLNERPN